MKYLFPLLLFFFSSNTMDAQTSAKSIVLCESYSTSGVPSGINSKWDIKKSTGGFVYILYKNGNAVIKDEVLLYVDKMGNNGKYTAFATEDFKPISGNKWVVFDYKFTEPGKYKIAAVDKNGNDLAKTYCEISYIDDNKTLTTKSEDNSKSIVLCESYDTKGKATGIYSTWNIKSDGGYVYILFNNGAKSIKNTLWLYIDKKNEKGEYLPFATQTFDTKTVKDWSVYDFNFKETGEYKIAAVSSSGEEAVTYATIKLSAGEKAKVEKKIVLCESYDDYGKPIGIGTKWNITKEKGYVYILFDNGEPITSKVSLFIDKKNTKGDYIAYDTRSFDFDEKKNWSVFDFNFKEAGEYKIRAYNKETLATTYATISYKTTQPVTTTTTTTKDKVDTWYYENSTVYFAQKKDASGNLINKTNTIVYSTSGINLQIQYNDNKPIKTTKVYVDIYSMDGTKEDFIETKELTTTISQKIINLTYSISKSGKYKFAFYNADNIFMNLGILDVTNSISSSSTQTTSSSKTTSNSQPIYSNTTSVFTSDNSPRIALVIGNGNYQTVGSLPNPVHDAEEMAKSLKTCGFEVTLVLNGNKKQMNEAITKFGQNLMAKKGTGFVYYAGHGIQSKGDNYIIPIDAQVSVEEDLQYECLNVGKILSKMEAAKNSMNIIALDACRNNPFERSWNRSAGNSSGLVGMNAPEGTIISFSTNPGNTASDGYGYNSPYTTAFLNQLKKPGLTIEQVLKGIAADVKKAVPGQLPWYSSSITGEFYFRP